MAEQLSGISITITAVVALQRAMAIHYFFLRRLMAYRKRALAIPTSWSDFITYPEPPLLLVLTVLLWITHRNPVEPSILQLARVAIGGVLALAALALQVWALRSLPGVSPGHYVLPEQRVVAGGPHALVRHPLYLQAIIVWFSIAVAFASPTTLLATLVYVAPSYIVYSRSEEKMMVERVGVAYQEYRDAVGGFVPRWWQRQG